MECIVGIGLLVVAGIAKAIQDVCASNFYESRLGGLNPYFWENSKSWRNKWLNGDKNQGEVFLGSSTIFVFLTDAWHMFDAIRNVALIGGVIFYTNWIALPIFLITFELTYKFLRK